MRKIAALVFTLPVALACATATDPLSWEQQIRAAEDRHVAAFASNDVAVIERLFPDDFLVNSPRYDVLDRDQLLSLVRAGALKTAAFNQDIERIRRYGELVVVMGADEVVFAPPAPNAGQVIRRRFTDLWQLRNGEWLFVARHANPICQ